MHSRTNSSGRNVPPPNERTTVYWDKKANTYLLQAQARRGLAVGAYGFPTEISASSFDATIAELALSALDTFAINVWSEGKSPRYAPQEYRAFTKRYLSISIQRLLTGEIIVKPLHRKAGGYVGLEGEGIKLSAEEARERLPGAIREAFAIAT